ncbi:tetratricopeptide repeat protein [Chlorobaculum thiosulfatiphilum]|uniref:Tetratricopeptide repeat protein n=1 Tax=Chlorobaculum thiosulfatiphilum TaxID=115852 RepID=A0A5C4S8P1_CHLTI|nr:tetratricopeptide repeat protein [Chlorobaculum thiosulfatiphilum]TNJ39860.1 tetratricopeptide repeat protein [Chlorobaculum thiosulfatiphilum]
MNTTQPQKSLPEPTFSDRMLEIGIKYKTQLTVLFVALCLIAGGTLFWMQKSRVDQAEASLALAKITPWIETGDINRAINGEGSIKGLNTIAKTWGSTPSGNLAKLYMGNILLNNGKPDEALAMYKSFKSDNKDLQASAVAGAAACHVQKKAFGEAAPEYEKASETAENETLKSMYLAKAAESYDSAGQPDKAAKLLDQVIKTWPATSAAGAARRTLLRLSGAGVQIPQI